MAGKYHPKYTAYEESCKKTNNIHLYFSSFLEI